MINVTKSILATLFVASFLVFTVLIIKMVVIEPAKLCSIIQRKPTSCELIKNGRIDYGRKSDKIYTGGKLGSILVCDIDTEKIEKYYWKKTYYFFFSKIGSLVDYGPLYFDSEIISPRDIVFTTDEHGSFDGLMVGVADYYMPLEPDRLTRSLAKLKEWSCLLN